MAIPSNENEVVQIPVEITGDFSEDLTKIQTEHNSNAEILNTRLSKIYNNTFALKNRLDSMGTGVPTGTIIAWAGLTPPAGFLECAGQSLKRLTYAGLFSAIGTVWGSTAADNFKLPDFKSAARFLRSRGDGLEVGMVQGDAIRNIKGDASLAQYGGLGNGAIAPATGLAQNVGTGTSGWRQSLGSVTGGSADKDFFDASRVVPTADENRPKNAVVMYCIKAVDEYINPAQVDISNFDQLKANREDVLALAENRSWQSQEYMPVLNSFTNSDHNLNLDPKKIKFDVILICKSPDQGYAVNESAMLITNLIMSVSASNVLVRTPAVISIYNKSTGGVVNAVLANWRYVFRIWY